MGVNEWIESLFECPPPNSLWGTPKCFFACLRRRSEFRISPSLSRKMCLHRLGMVGIGCRVYVDLSCPSLREYTSDPSWMEYSVLVQFFLRLWQGRAASGLTGWRDFPVFVNLQIWLLCLVFFFLKKSIELYFLCKINGPVDWAAARAKISLGFSVISRAGPFVQGVKERSFLWQWKHANLFSVLCEMNGRRKCFLADFLNLWDQFLGGFVLAVCAFEILVV